MLLRDSGIERLPAFFRSLRRREPAAHVAPIGRDQAAVIAPQRAGSIPATDRALMATQIPLDRAVASQDKRRAQLEAEHMAEPYIKGLRAGDYAYRVLKAGFDELCEEAAIDPISDRRFARLLQEHGGKRYRCNYPKTTMYTMPRRRAAARPAASMEARC